MRGSGSMSEWRGRRVKVVCSGSVISRTVPVEFLLRRGMRTRQPTATSPMDSGMA